jgi:hypothetical protein
MKPFRLPILCALAFVALFSLALWDPAWFVQPAVLAWTYGLTAITAATVVTMIRAVAGRVRGSRGKGVAFWIIATPTVIATCLLAVLTPFTNGAEDDFGALLLLFMVSLFGVVCCGLTALLILAALPKKAALQ